MGVRYAAMTYEFKTTEKERINRAAQQLPDDVKAIMLNSGGPVAAQTVYPILDRNYQGLGLAIAVVPSPVTVDSIQQTFQFKPLLSLRSTTAALAKGVMNLSPRATVKSTDEFGELAADLNHFLDRVKRIAAREMGSFEVIVQTLDELISAKLPNDKDAQSLKGKLEQLRASFMKVSDVVRDVTPAPVLVDKEASQYLALSQALREMATLEGSMQRVAEAGRTLVKRLENGKAS
jgi:methyl-accepting chemotaxis protein